jgi:glycine/D-amino acid oxidase-like deaminating enzyme
MAMETLPIAVIGAGPVGLAAAAHLVSRGETPIVLEAGEHVGATVRRWAHVRVFSPWRYNVDPVAAAMLQKAGWPKPDPEHLPTGRELVADYLEPLAALPEIRPHVRLRTRVVSVSRRGHDKLRSSGREHAPFVLRVVTPDGEEAILARAVIDASGTYESPSPLGADGTPVRGEAEIRDRVFYAIPEALGAQRSRYAGRHVAVVGSGHSALNTLLDLAELRKAAPGTRVTWIVRRPLPERVFGGGAADALPARGALGQDARRLLERGGVTLVVGRIASVASAGGDVAIFDESGATLAVVDEVVAVTGFRPDLELLRELRLDLDPIMEAPRALAPLIDPNVHSCGTVPPHGVQELAQPEPGFFVVGMKSYGRAPTFLMLTGYEQVRSIACALTGDAVGAATVELTLPETGVCGAPSLESSIGASCCGGPAPAHVDACCARDAEAKALGHDGCGCGSSGADAVLAGSDATSGARRADAEAPREGTKRDTLQLVSFETRAGGHHTTGCCR